jgi:hypothetical protein
MKRIFALLIITALLTACAGEPPVEIPPAAEDEPIIADEPIITTPEIITTSPATTTTTPPPEVEPEPEFEPLPPLEFFPAADPNERGNTTGNIINGGNAAMQGEWIYYNVSSAGIDRTPPTHLVKIRADGTDRTIIADIYSYNINVVGDWIYYVGESVNRWTEGIFRIRTDGTDWAQLSREDAEFMTVVGDWIYYSNRLFRSDGSILKMRTDGTEKTLITNEPGWDINVVDDWVYFVSHDDSFIYKIRTDGTDKTKLNNVESRNIIVYDDWIYYMSGNQWGRGEFYRIRTDGTEETPLNFGHMYSFNISDDWIYFVALDENRDDNEYSNLYKSRLDGSEREMLLEGFYGNFTIYSMNIVSGWVQYYVGNGWAMPFIVNTDGTDDRVLDGDLLFPDD